MVKSESGRLKSNIFLTVIIITVIYSFLFINSIWFINDTNTHFINRSPTRNLFSKMQFANWTNPYDMSLLPANDSHILLDRTDFQFVMNNFRCNLSNSMNSTKNNVSNNELFLVIFVHSAPKNFDKRRAIRSTWGNEHNLNDDKMRLVFLVGFVSDSSIQQKLVKENKEFEDLIQGNFVDSYRNLTYKHVMGLKWVAYFCQNAKFVFKTDDDIFVDIFQLMFYLKGSHGHSFPPRNLMSCYVISNPYPKRSQRSKWRVTFKEYPRKYYPLYCSGWGIVMSPDIVFKLYFQSRNISYFWVDDVLVTGLLAERIGVNHIDLRYKLAIEKNEIEDWLTDKTLSMPPLFGHPDTDIETIYALWNKTLSYYKIKYKSFSYLS